MCGNPDSLFTPVVYMDYHLMTIMIWIVIVASVVYLLRKAYIVIIDRLNAAYADIIRARISNKFSDSRDCTSIYQGLYLDQVSRYSSMIKHHLKYLQFLELFRSCYPDGILTHSRIRAVVAYLVYGVPSTHSTTTQREEQIVPQGNTCIPIHKTLNQLTRYFESIYMTFDSTLDFHRLMETIIVDRTNMFSFNKMAIDTVPIRYFNRIRHLIDYDTIDQTIQKIRTYIKLYSDLRSRNFEVIDLNEQRVRLFVYTPKELNLEYLSTNSMADRRSMTTLGEQRELSNRRIKIYYPVDLYELESIIETIDLTLLSSKENDTPIVITQIESIFPTYNYNGSDLNIFDKSSTVTLVRGVPSIYRYFYDMFLNDNGWNFTSQLNRTDGQDIDKNLKIHPYSSVVSDAVRVFDLIKDSGLISFGTIDIRLQGPMTILAPQIMVLYDRLDLYPNLKFKLIDPICYPYSFHRIYDSIRNDSDSDSQISRIKNNPMMMEVLNELSLIDIFVDSDEKSHPIFSDRIRIHIFSDPNCTDIYTDSEYLKRVLCLRSKVSLHTIGEKLINIACQTEPQLNMLKYNRP
jgi:hypothetical protein